MEETCNVQLEPVLEAGVPSVDVEEMQGDAPDFGSMDISARKPRVNMTEPQVDMPEGTLKTQISGPNEFSEVDLSSPSTGLDLPSTKKKSGSCFSCASTGDKEEPYSKGRANAGLDLDRPDMKTDGNVKMSGSRPDVSVPSGPSVNGEDFDFDSSYPDVDISKRPKAHLDTNAPSIETPQSNLAAQISRPEVGLSTGTRQAPKGQFDAQSTEENLPSKKTKGGNCFSCISDTKKDEPYRKRRENVDLDIDGQGDSMEMSTGRKFDLSRSGPDIQGAEGRIPHKEQGFRASATDADSSGPDFSIRSSSAEMRTGKFDLDGSGPNIQGTEGRLPQKELGLRFSTPEVDLDVDKKRNIDISGPNMSLPTSSAAAKISGRSFGGDGDACEPNLDIKASKPKVEIGANGQDFAAPDWRPESEDTSVKLHGPSPQINLPSSKRKRGNCLKCTGTGRKEEPYRKASDVGYTFDGHEAGGSMEMKKIAGPYFDVHGREGGVSGPDSGVLGIESSVSGPDFVVQGSHAAVSRPDFDIGGTDFGVRRPDADVSELDVNAPKTGISGPRSSLSGPDFDVREPNVDISEAKPKMVLDTNMPSVNAPEGKISTKVPGPNVDVSTGNIEDTKVTVDRPSTGFHVPSKKMKGGNCLSCTGSPDKDEPYRKSKGNTEFVFNGPDVYTEGPDADIEGPKRKSENAFNLSAAAPGTNSLNLEGDPGISVTNTSFPSTSGGGQFDVSGIGPDLGIKTKKTGAEYDANGSKLNKPKGELQTEIPSPDVDVSTGNVRGPSSNGRLPTSKKARGNCLSCAGDADKDEPYGKSLGSTEFKLEKPDIDGSLKIQEGGKFDLDEPSINITDPEFEGTTPEIDFPTDKAKVAFTSPGRDPGISVTNTSFPSTSGGGEFDVSGIGPDLGIKTNKTGVEYDANGSKLKKSKGKLQTEMPSPDVDVSTGNVREPSSNGRLPTSKKARGNCLSCAGDADKDEPYGKSLGSTEFKLEKPDIDGSLKIHEGGKFDLDEPSVNITDPEFEGTTPEIDFPSDKAKVAFTSPEFDIPNMKGNREIQITRPEFSHEKPKMSGPSFGTGDKEFVIGGPDLDIDTSLGDTPKPDITGPKSKIEVDTNRPDLDFSATEPQFGVKGLHIDSPEPDKHAGDLRFDGSMPDLDFKRPGLDVSATKPRFGVKRLDTDTPEPDIHNGDLSFPGSIPDLGLSGKKLEIGLAMDGPDKKIEKPEGKIDLDVNRPGLDDSGRKPQFGIKGLDMNTPEPVMPANNLRFGTTTPDVNWGVKTSTPKVPERHPELDIETKPLDGNISVANDFNFELQSTPQTFPSLDYEKPRSLQRYDEIRPDMELRLLSPKPTEHPDHNFDFNSSLDMEQGGEQLKPARMSLVKVEENVTVCSASLEEDDSPSPRNRTLTLDREIKQQIEVVFPEEEDLNEKRKSSTSSSSSSDADADREKTSKRKKKSRLLKASRKTSTSSASSKEEGGPVKKKTNERRSSTSSSSSDDENKRKKDRKKGSSEDVVLPTVRTEQKKTATSSSSSSSDEAPTTVIQVNLANRKESSNSSSDDEERKIEMTANEIPAPEVETVISVKCPEPDVSLDAVTTVAPSLPVKSEKLKERKSSTSSSSSDEDTKKENVVQTKEPKERKSSTSSTSSTDKDDSKDKKVSTQYHVSEETKEPEKTMANMPTLVSHTVKPSGPGLSIGLEKPEDSAEPKQRKSSTSSSSDTEVPTNKMAPDDSKPSMLYQVEYFTNQQTYIIESHEDLDKPVLSVADVQEEAPKVEFHSVDPRDPEISFVKPLERKSSTSSSSSSDEEANDEKKDPVRKSSKTSSSSDDSGRVSPKLHTTLYRYETVHHILTPDYPSVDQANLQIEQEHPVVVVSRSFKDPMSENISTVAEDQYEPQNAETQFSEPPVDMTYHLEYPYDIPSVKADSDKRVNEEDIVPVAKLKSDFLFELEPDDKPSEGKDSTEYSITAGKEDHDPSTLNIQTHTFETVYHVDIPENLAVDGDSLEIREDSPIVVSRSVKRISLGGVDQEGEPPLITTNTDIQFNEPNNDFQLEYPEGDNVFTTDEHDLKVKDEKWIVSHSLQKEEPDIPALVASLDRHEEKTEPRNDSSRDEGDKVTSREKSPKDITRRGSNSRLWELMQGYLIETPITDDDETKAEAGKGVQVEEIANPEPKAERTVYRASLKPTKLNAPVQVVDKEPTKEVIPSGPKVDNNASKVVPSFSQIDPVALQVDLGGKKPEVKEHHAGWKKQSSLPVDEDDNEDDPWMRHYSRGLQRGQRQPASTKSPEKESTQSRGLSLSKVPHVRGIRTSAEREHERPRYTIEGLTRTEPMASRSSTEEDQVGKSIESGRPSVSTLRSFWDK